MSTLERSIEIAHEAHAGQYDKGGAAYINHPLRVMEKGKTEEEKIVGVLHDVVEDSEWTFSMLISEGFSLRIISALRCLTKRSEDEDYDEFISRVLKDELAARVKLNDLEDNLDLSRLETVSSADIKRCEKYRRARSRIIEGLEFIAVREEEWTEQKGGGWKLCIKDVMTLRSVLEDKPTISLLKEKSSNTLRLCSTLAQRTFIFAPINHLRNACMGVIICIVLCLNVISYMCGGNQKWGE